MKASFKNVIWALLIVLAIVVVLSFVDSGSSVETSAAETLLRITVVDLNEQPVHNAEVVINGEKYVTDNKGLSPNIQLQNLENSYDQTIEHWGTVTVVVRKDGFVPSVTVNCVVFNGQTRRLTVKLYQQDGSNLPYVCYVESPPEEYISQLLSQ